MGLMTTIEETTIGKHEVKLVFFPDVFDACTFGCQFEIVNANDHTHVLSIPFNRLDQTEAAQAWLREVKKGYAKCKTIAGISHTPKDFDKLPRAQQEGCWLFTHY